MGISSNVRYNNNYLRRACIIMDKIIKGDKPDFIMTMEEIRTVRTILSTLISKNMLPWKQNTIVQNLITKMDKSNMGELN